MSSQTIPEPVDDVASRVEVLVVTGMSGAGRTHAAKVLEDLGYFVIDNLPPMLISRVTELARTPGSSVDRIVLVTDVRGREFFDALEDEVSRLREAEDVDLRLIFLEASDDELVARFEASRRRHPMGADDGVLTGIRREREHLEALRGSADLVLDTSDLTVHDLRDRLVEVFGTAARAALQISVVSFGFKYGLPRDADIVLDVRFLPNPHWVEDLRPYNGLDDPVRDYVLGQDSTGPYLERVEQLLEVSVPGFIEEGKRYLTIAVGCTGGKHRSVVVSERIGAHLRASTDLPVTVDHRDLGRE
ncbi:MAG: RNase adapter RapZ [Actinobacteria bacterium]|nr:RNase adapter RapZ [Actinomycetota bacterium]